MRCFWKILPGSSSKRLVVITRHPPLPDIDGAGAYLWDLLTYLSESGIQIDIASTWIPDDWARSSLVCVPKKLNDVARIHFPYVLNIGRWRWMRWGSFKARSFHNIRRLVKLILRDNEVSQRACPIKETKSLSNLPTKPWHALPDKEELRFFQKIIHRCNPDAVMANFCWLTPAIQNISTVDTMVLTHDIMHEKLNLWSTSSLMDFPDPSTFEGESDLIQKVKCILAISDADAAMLDEMSASSSKVFVVPKAARRNVPPANIDKIRGRILFVGSDGANNREGLNWFIENVWPEIRNKFKDASLHVVGDICQSAKLKSEDHIFLQGRVSDLSKEYHLAEVVIVPLQRGTGVKIKLVEALSHGCAVVSTSVGLQGLSAFESTVIKCDTAKDFVGGILRCLNNSDEAARLGKKALELVGNQLHPDKCYGAVRDRILHSVKG